MRKILLAISLLCAYCVPALANAGSVSQMPGRQQLQWYTNYNQAVQVAQQKNAPLFLFFTGSNWCGWCKKMVSEVFASPDFVQSVGNSFVFVEIDFPTNYQLPPDIVQQNEQLKNKFGISGYPTVIILSPDQKVLAKTGYRQGGGRAYRAKGRRRRPRR